MPMIDVTAPESLIPHSDEGKLLSELTKTLIKYEGTGSIPQFVSNTGATFKAVPKADMCAGGEPAQAVRIVILTPPNVLTQKQRQAITTDFTQKVVQLSGKSEVAQHTWVQFVEAVDGGWGVAGHAYTNAELKQAAIKGLVGSLVSPTNVGVTVAVLAVGATVIGKFHRRKR